MSSDELVEHLKDGYELHNRGTGWWLVKPRKPYGPRASIEVDRDLVNDLEGEGVLLITMRSTSMFATLVK